jgi:hypothetical protein
MRNDLSKSREILMWGISIFFYSSFLSFSPFLFTFLFLSFSLFPFYHSLPFFFISRSFPFIVLSRSFPFILPMRNRYMRMGGALVNLKMIDKAEAVFTQALDLAKKAPNGSKGYFLFLFFFFSFSLFFKSIL